MVFAGHKEGRFAEPFASKVPFEILNLFAQATMLFEDLLHRETFLRTSSGADPSWARSLIFDSPCVQSGSPNPQFPSDQAQGLAARVEENDCISAELLVVVVRRSLSIETR
jgi:hypothetical protein